MSDFFVKTSLLNFFIWIGHIIAWLGLFGIFLEYIFSLSHYEFVTDCTPSCTTWYPFGNFRPAGDVPNIGSLDPLKQERALFFRFDYWVLGSDLLRVFYPCLWFFTSSFVREPGIFFFHAMALIVFAVIEIVKIVIFSVAILSPGDYWFAFYPYPESSIASVQFWVIFWYCIGALAYITLQFILILSISLLARKAKKEERQSGNVPIPIIESKIRDPIERKKSSKLRRREKIDNDIVARIFNMKNKYGKKKKKLMY